MPRNTLSASERILQLFPQVPQGERALLLKFLAMMPPAAIPAVSIDARPGPVVFTPEPTSVPGRPIAAPTPARRRRTRTRRAQTPVHTPPAATADPGLVESIGEDDGTTPIDPE